MTYEEYLESIAWGNDWRVPLIIWGIIILGVFVGCLLITVKHLFQEIEVLKITKQDDQSQYITDGEWFKLCDQYKVKISVKPIDKITLNQAIRILEFIKERSTL